VQSDRVDKVQYFILLIWVFGVYHKFINCQSAVGWDYQEKLGKHESQTDGTKGGITHL